MSTFSYSPAPFCPFPPGEPHTISVPPSTPHQVEPWAMVGDSAAIKRLRLQIRRIGPHFRTVLISGEQGTGRQTVARALHQMSLGADGPFIVSASGNRISYLTKLARRGTLYFDCIDKMPLDTQDELLEILHRNEWAQDGLAAPQRMHPRIIASTRHDLRTLAAASRFRQELYHRIAMVQIALPPLRERIEDIPALASDLLQRFTRIHRRNITITNDATDWLKSCAWPGNIRELEKILETAALQAEDSLITAEQLSALAECFGAHSDEAARQDASEPARLQDVVEQHVLHVLKNCAGNKLRAAELLGISRSTLYRMLDASSVEPRHDIGTSNRGALLSHR